MSECTHADDSLPNSPVTYVHSISGSGRLLPSASRWNSIEFNVNVFPQSSIKYDSLPSRFSRSVDFNLVIADRTNFKRFLFIFAATIVLVPTLVLLIHFLPRRHHEHSSSKDLTLALNRALVFFDAQKSGNFPKNSTVKFRGDSGLKDGDENRRKTELVGGFYDSGNNVKFSFPTAYTITLLSWTVLEYHPKYADIGELDHVKNIIRWGTDYLLKLFVPPNTNSQDPTILYSQVGGTLKEKDAENDISCWQRPEDMRYPRPVSVCSSSSKASDLAGEIVAALSAASLVFKQEKDYSSKLIKSAEKLYRTTMKEGPNHKQGTYTTDKDCGGQAMEFYNSSGYKDELVWGGTWLFLASGNTSYLKYATSKFAEAEKEELFLEKGIFSWNNKLAASAILLTRLRFFRDLGFPYEVAFGPSANRTDLLMCSYLFDLHFKKTKGGLILLKPETSGPLQYAATASFLSKLYSDYLELLSTSGSSCSTNLFSLDMLRGFATSQVKYILGDNPMKLSYVVGFEDKYPTHVHHRAASIPWDEQWHSCGEGERWFSSKRPNPNTLLGAMVGGPDKNDKFLDDRDKPWFTEPTISSNAGLVAALIALHPINSSSNSIGFKLGLDIAGLFENVRLVSSTPAP